MTKSRTKSLFLHFCTEGCLDIGDQDLIFCDYDIIVVICYDFWLLKRFIYINMFIV